MDHTKSTNFMCLVYSSALWKSQYTYTEAHTFNPNLFPPHLPLQLTISNLFVILWLLSLEANLLYLASLAKQPPVLTHPKP